MKLANRGIGLWKYLIVASGVSIIGIIIFWVFSPGSSAPNTSVRDRRIVLDLAQVRLVMNYIHTQHGNYDRVSCDHEDMIALCRDIDRNRGLVDEAEPIITHDFSKNSQAVCIYSPLNVKDRYWYCADSTGQAGYTETDPGRPGYCAAGESAICPPFLKTVP